MCTVKYAYIYVYIYVYIDIYIYMYVHKYSRRYILLNLHIPNVYAHSLSYNNVKVCLCVCVFLKCVHVQPWNCETKCIDTWFHVTDLENMA